MGASVRTIDAEEIAGDWEDLLPSCWTNTIFVTPWWQSIWHKHFGDPSSPRILAATDGSGALLGIAPMNVSDGTVTFMGDTNLFDYRDFLVSKGTEDIFYPAVLDEIATWEWDTLVLESVPEGSPTIRFATSAAKKNHWNAAIEEEDNAPFKSLPGNWEDYVSGLGKKYRHELRRKIRKLGNSGQVTQYDCTPEMLPEHLPDFFRLHRLSSPDKAEFMTEVRERFFTELIEASAARGRLKLSMLEFDGVRVAACINFDYEDSYLLYNSGYDPAYSQLSVGFVNKALTIKDAIESGKRTFDFLRGTERYKYDLGAEDRSIYTIRISR
ncbi:MAG: GNAT family N-acetyltransferase [Chloroflexi bacterium]|nr:GNAT family N-acetyltransferase [Chloroflexota bacterium]